MKGIRYALNLLIAIYILILLALVLPPLAGFHIYAVISPSMAPKIPTGSAVYVKPKAFAEISPGDIITYRLNNQETGGDTYVTHRVVSCDPSGYTFRVKGDANETEDAGDVPYANVVGSLRFSLPYLGYVATVLEGMGQKLYLAGAFLWLMVFRALAGGDTALEEKDMDEEKEGAKCI